MGEFTYSFSKSEDTLQGIAERYKTSDERIWQLSKEGGKTWATEQDQRLASFPLGYMLQDGDELIVPIPDPLPSLPAGAEWKPYITTDGETLSSVIEKLRSPNPVGRIVEADAQKVGPTIWSDYRNADVRRATVMAGAPQGSSIAGAIPVGSKLFVPVFLLVEQVILVAPSPVDKPQIGGTVEVAPDDRFSGLARYLQDVEIALDDVDAVRARVALSIQTAQGICGRVSALQRSMVDVADDYRNANKLYASNAHDAGRYLNQEEAHEGEAARDAALESIAVLNDKVWQKLYGQPVWKKEYPTHDGDLKATIRRLKERISDTTMMALLVEIVPTMFAVPMSVRRARLFRAKRTGMACLDYICFLAARAAAALSGSLDKSDWANLAVLPKQTKKAGVQCTDIIEYACACTRGFETSPPTRPMSSAPHSCLGVVCTLYAGQAIETAWTTTERGARRLDAIKAFGIIVNNFDGLLKPAGANAAAKDEPESWWNESLKQKVEAYSLGKEAAVAATTALELSKPLKESDACRFLAAFMSPFENEHGFLRVLLPKSVRSTYAAFQTLWAVGSSSSKALDEGSKETPQSFAATSASLIDIPKGLLEGASAMELFEENGAALEVAEDAVAILGRACFVLTIVAEGFEAQEAAEHGRTVEAGGHAALAGSSFCFLVGSAVTGAGAAATGGVIIAVGAALMVGGIVATKGELAAEIYKGEAPALFEGLISSNCPLWAGMFAFDEQLTELRECFERANFAAGAAASRVIEAGRLATGHPSL